MSEKKSRENRDKLNKNLKKENIRLHNEVESLKNLNNILQQQIVEWSKKKEKKSAKV